MWKACAKHAKSLVNILQTIHFLEQCHSAMQDLYAQQLAVLDAEKRSRVRFASPCKRKLGYDIGTGMHVSCSAMVKELFFEEIVCYPHVWMP